VEKDNITFFIFVYPLAGVGCHPSDTSHLARNLA
jgi:hypothetical protein